MRRVGHEHKTGEARGNGDTQKNHAPDTGNLFIRAIRVETLSPCLLMTLQPHADGAGQKRQRKKRRNPNIGISAIQNAEIKEIAGQSKQSDGEH